MNGLAEKRNRRASWLRCHTPVFGWIIRRIAVLSLCLSRSPYARRMLADEVPHSSDQGLNALILFVLRWITDSSSIAEICASWTQSRHPALARLITDQQWNPDGSASVRVLVQLKANSLDALVSGDADVVKPLIDACDDPDSEIAIRARECVVRLTNPNAVDALCAQWAEWRDPVSSRVVCVNQLVARAPPLVHVLTLLRNARTDLLSIAAASLVEPIAQALFDQDSEIRNAAETALGCLENPEAKDMVCQLVIDFGLPEYRKIAARAGYLPSDPAQRALFFFLTEQWDRYLELDFDQKFLGMQFENGTAKIRSRIAETARLAGRTEWIKVIHSGRRSRRLKELSDEEWDAAVTVMEAGKRWIEMWHLAQSAQADWAWRLIDRLRQSAWTPAEPSDVALFSKLGGLLDRCERHSGFSGRLIRSGYVIGRHTGKLTCMDLTKNGLTVAAGSEDHTVTILDVAGKTSPKTMRGHSDWILCIATSPDGCITATGSADGTARLWNTSNGDLKGILHGHTGEIRCIGFSLDGSILVTGSTDKSIRLWSTRDSSSIQTLLGHVDYVSCLALSPDGRLLATGSYDNEIRLWTLPEGNPIATMKGHRAMVNCLAFDPSSTTLISGGKDRNIVLWRTPDGTLLRRLKGHREDISCVAVSPDGSAFASGSWDTTIRLWRLVDGELLDTLGRSRTNDGHSSWVTCLTYSPDGKFLASGGCDNTVRLWSVPGGAPLRVLEGHHDRVIAVRFTPDSMALISGSRDKSILLWRSELARLRRIPIGETTVEDLDWVEKTLSNSLLVDVERAWMEFLAALMRWRRRFDIHLGDASKISVGEFDIELEA
ncbi:MAG: hypothetical protein O2960_13785 [Verrucomicrobia bacterium]|nr:hypothetical protein [Verrucomicrobiota bacterium]